MSHYRHLRRKLRGDGCNDAPDLNFRLCCERHDRAYAVGGRPSRRKHADAVLRYCISSHGHPILAWVYWIAVRLFGGKHWRVRDE